MIKIVHVFLFEEYLGKVITTAIIPNEIAEDIGFEFDTWTHYEIGSTEYGIPVSHKFHN